MKALTVYQPWASLECRGLKGTETRSWPTAYRGPLAIHAGVKWNDYLRERQRELDAYLVRCGGLGLSGDLPRGVILGIGILVDCLQVTEGNQTMFSAFDRVAGDLSLGRWVWVLDDVRPLRHPVACRGMQGIWAVPGRVQTLIDRQQTADRRRDLRRDAKLEADRGGGPDRDSS